MTRPLKKIYLIARLHDDAPFIHSLISDDQHLYTPNSDVAQLMLKKISGLSFKLVAATQSSNHLIYDVHISISGPSVTFGIKINSILMRYSNGTTLGILASNEDPSAITGLVTEVDAVTDGMFRYVVYTAHPTSQGDGPRILYAIGEVRAVMPDAFTHDKAFAGGWIDTSQYNAEGIIQMFYYDETWSQTVMQADINDAKKVEIQIKPDCRGKAARLVVENHNEKAFLEFMLPLMKERYKDGTFSTKVIILLAFFSFFVLVALYCMTRGKNRGNNARENELRDVGEINPYSEYQPPNANPTAGPQQNGEMLMVVGVVAAKYLQSV
eukprot:TRINITY_DN20068_c0_g1_i2.p1 TRINITY_DN20068_c0_g1~~TRINITY_DN20068_c0_g1_i2.p1  ORF type:complete len:325 (-),score=34.15 TRINITY_DN20068_c0_g1_i2:167-1141(-)